MSEETLESWLERTRKFPEIVQCESTNQCNANCIMCLDGETKILMSNFVWNNLKDIKIGDEVIGFKRGEGKNEQTKIIKTKVIATMSRESERIKLIAEGNLCEEFKGKYETEIICTPTHQFVDVAHKSRYKEAKSFKNGQKIKFLIPPISMVECDENYKIGYLTGCMDGDGCLYHEKANKRTYFQLAMKDLEAIDRFIQYSKEFGITTIGIRKHQNGFSKESIIHRVRIIRKKSVDILLKITRRPRMYTSFSWLCKNLEEICQRSSTREKYDAGYLAGFFDCDGSFTERGIHLLNTNMRTVIRLKHALDNLCFKYKIEKINPFSYGNKMGIVKKRDDVKYKKMYSIRILGGHKEQLRFFLKTNPAINRKKKWLFKAVRNSIKKISEESIGVGKVYNIETDSGNYIANGFLSKNCPISSKMTRPKEHMSREVFMKVVEDCVGEYVPEFHLHQSGEPLMIGIKELAWRIDYAKSKLPNSKVGFFSNGSLMFPLASDYLLEFAPPDFVVFSFDGGDKESYENVRRGLNFEQTVSNIKYFSRRRAELDLKKQVRCTVQFIACKLNEDKIPQFMQLFGDCELTTIGTVGLVNYAGAINTDPIMHRFQNKTGKRTDPCWRLYTNMVVQSDGNVALCCNSWDAEVIMGNVMESTLKDIWQGEMFKKYRTMHQEHKQAELDVCKRCDYTEWFEPPKWYFK